MAKGSKWAKLKEKFKALPMDADYSAKIEAILNSPVPENDLVQAGLGDLFNDSPMRTLANPEITALYRYWRRQLDDLKAIESVINAQVEAAEQKIAEHFDANDLLTQKFDDGASLTVAPDPIVTVAKESEFYSWVREDANRKAIFNLKEYIHPQTAKAQVKLLLEQNAELPPGIEVNYINKLTLRDAK